MRALYTLLWHLALPFLPLRLWWRGRREPGYREHIGERFGRYATTRAPASRARCSGSTRCRSAKRARRVPLVDRLTPRVPGSDRAAHAHDGDRPRRRARALRRRASSRRGCPTTCRSRCAPSLRISPRAPASSWRPSCGRTSSRSRTRRACRSILVNARMSERSAAGYARIPLAHAADAGGARRRRRTDGCRRGAACGARRARARWSPATSSSTSASPTPPWRWAANSAQRFGETRPVWVAGSTRDGEEALILDALAARAAAAGDADGHRAAASAALRRGRRAAAPARHSVRRAAATTRPCRPTSPSCSAIRWARWPGTARRPTSCSSAAACCRSGGQNLIEPIAVGRPTLVGPHMFNFAEATAKALAAGAALESPMPTALIAEVAALIGDRGAARGDARRGARLPRGASRRRGPAVGVARAAARGGDGDDARPRRARPSALELRG